MLEAKPEWLDALARQIGGAVGLRAEPGSSHVGRICRASLKAKTCPLCGKPEVTEHAPFCSRGCKDRDLLKWLGEGYRIPGPPADPDRVDSEESDG